MFYLKTLKKRFRQIHQMHTLIENFDRRIDALKLNQGMILTALNEHKKTKNLQAYEFSIFSQWGEDGMIQQLIKSIEIKNKTFIEFGVENFMESNCRFLLMKDNWKGFVIDGSAQNMEDLKNADFYWKYNLESIAAFITKDNINSLLEKSGFDEDLGILSIDLDGNDYYILEAIAFFKPRILIVEFNAVFGAERKISIPYQADFNRTNAHYSNLYCGASLAAITFLAAKKGYTLVGTNTASVNAFYVRNDVWNNQLESLTAEQAFTTSHFRDSRDENGKLTYVSGNKRLDLIKGLPVYNVETQLPERI